MSDTDFRQPAFGRLSDLGVDMTPRLKVLATVEPQGRKAGVKVATVADLVMKLKTETGVFQ